MPDINRIGAFIQKMLTQLGMSEVPAVEAARWLDEHNILRDSRNRPGMPLRRLLRDGRILGQRQVKGRWWYIDRI